MSSCTGTWPERFDPSRDQLTLTYDCSPDPDDLESAVADRALLQATFGLDWLTSERVLPVGGTFGDNGWQSGRFLEPACEMLLRAVWEDTTGYMLAGSRNASLHGTRRASAASRIFLAWKATIERGGQIYVKEGGQSDVSVKAARLLDGWRPGSARSVHIVQVREAALASSGLLCGLLCLLWPSLPSLPSPTFHRLRVHPAQHAPWNERQTGRGAIAWALSHTDYCPPAVVGDGNFDMQRCPNITASRLQCHNHDGLPPPAGFKEAAEASWLGCAWRMAFREFEAAGFRYPGMIDFSDTHELAFILRIQPIPMEAFLERYVQVRDASPHFFQCCPPPTLH